MYSRYSRHVQAALLTSCGALAICALPAYAQSAAANAANQAATDAATSDADSEAQNIIVTGSRIVRDGYSQPTPVTVARTEDLVQATPTNLPDALNKLPQFLGSSSPTNNTQTNANQPTHGNVLNLRGVGGIRTLILQDGVRVPPTAFTGTVDTNIIPQLLVERVDVVTAGASAAYGSDAVTGVVNFVLNKKFNGLKAVAQRGISSRGDNGNYRLGVAGGFDFGEHGHFIGSYERFDSDGLTKPQRPRLYIPGAALGSVVGGGTPGTPGNPYKFYRDARFTLSAFGGQALSGPFAGTIFTTPNSYNTSPNRGTPTGSGGFNLGGDYYWIKGPTSLVSPLTTDQAFGRLSYDLSDNVTAFVSGSFGRTQVEFDTLANSIFPTVFSGNAYLPQALQDRLTATNTSAFAFSKYFIEAPLPHTREDTKAFNAIAGLSGKVGRFDWDVSYVYGRSDMKVAQSNVFELPKFYAAIDAVRDSNNNIVCRASLNPDPAIAARYANCKPLNLFGEGAASAASLDYVNGVSRYRAINESNDIAATISGDLIDLWAGPLSVAVGAEYRDQSLKMTSNADPAVRLDVSGLRGIAPTTERFFLTNLGVADGRVKVKEGFIEAALPLLRDMAFAHRADINGAFRHTDYSTSGGVNTWKLGATWSPIPDLTFRVTRSRDIRAPTVFDLFAGTQFNIQGAYDPHTNTSGSLPTATGGNPNLRPEIGNTLTYGVVFSPSFLPGFNAAIDFYDLKIRDAIGLLSATQILQTCEDSGGTSPVCGLVVRPLPYSDTSTNNFPTQVNVAGANIASLETRGFDAEATYRTEVGADSSLGLRLFVSYSDRFRTQQSLSDPVIETAGYSPRPKWRGTANVNFATGPWNIAIQEQYIGKVGFGDRRVGLPDAQQTNVYAEPPIKPYWYTDLTVSVKVPTSAKGNFEFFTTVNNLFDRQPPFAPFVSGGGAPGLVYPTTVALYDVVGRRFTFGVRVNM